jgi:hypothetical protein
MVMCWLLHTGEVSGVLVWGIGRSIINIVKEGNSKKTYSIATLSTRNLG